MPNRIIRESCCTSPTLDQLSDGAERMFWRLTTVADDQGRFDAHPSVLLAKCFPLKVTVLKTASVLKWILELEQAGLAVLYTVDGREYGYFTNWSKYQRSYGNKPKHPDPSCGKLRQPAGDCGGLRESAALNLNLNRDLESRIDTSIAHSEVSLTSEVNSEFETFWEAYPKRNGKRIGRQRSLCLFMALGEDDRQLCITATRHYAASDAAARGFSKDPERFLKAAYWREWIEPETSQAIVPLKPKRSTYHSELLGKIQALEIGKHG